MTGEAGVYDGLDADGGTVGARTQDLEQDCGLAPVGNDTAMHRQLENGPRSGRTERIHANAMGGSVTDTNQVQNAVGCFLSGTVESFEFIVGERVASALDINYEEAAVLLGFYLGPDFALVDLFAAACYLLRHLTFHVRYSTPSSSLRLPASA